MSTETLGISNKADLLAKAEHMYVATRAVVDTVSAERFDEKLPAGMTLREIVAHLAAWEETVPRRVASVLARGVDTDDNADIDAFNARVFDETRDATIDDLRTRFARSHTALVEVIRSFWKIIAASLNEPKRPGQCRFITTRPATGARLTWTSRKLMPMPITAASFI